MTITVEKGGEPMPEIAPIRTRTVDDRIMEAEHVAQEQSIPVAEVLLNEIRAARQAHEIALWRLRSGTGPTPVGDDTPYERRDLESRAKEIGAAELALILWGARAEATIHELRRRES